MKKLTKTAVLTILLVGVTASLMWAGPREETAVFRLTAYIPESKETAVYDRGFSLASTAYTLSYSIQQETGIKVFLVVAT